MNSIKKSINVSPLLNPGTGNIPPPPPHLELIHSSIPPGIQKVLQNELTEHSPPRRTLFPFSPNCLATPQEILGELARNNHEREIGGMGVKSQYGTYRAEIIAPNPNSRGTSLLKQIVTLRVKDDGDNLAEHQKGLCELNLVINTKHPYFKNQRVLNVVKLT